MEKQGIEKTSCEEQSFTEALRYFVAKKEPHIDKMIETIDKLNDPAVLCKPYSELEQININLNTAVMEFMEKADNYPELAELRDILSVGVLTFQAVLGDLKRIKKAYEQSNQQLRQMAINNIINSFKPVRQRGVY